MFIALMLVALLPLVSFAQASKGSAEREKGSTAGLYKLNVKFMTNVYHKYIFTEESKITRTSSDNKTVTFDRKVIYHFNLRQNSLPVNGFNEVNVLLDSLEYYLSEDGVQKYAYNSQDEEADTPYGNLDYMNYGIPLGKDFAMNYSPYNEVADIKGEILGEFKSRLNHPEDGIKDEKMNYMWNRYLGNDYLIFLSDVMKNMIPEAPVDRDSTWRRVCKIYVDGVKYIDTIDVALTDFNPRQYVLKADLDKLIGKEEPVNIIGFNELSQITAPKGKGTITMTVSPRGQVNLAEIESETEFKFKIEKIEYKQKTQTKYTWKLDKMFR